MKIISHNLLPRQKHRKQGLNVNIDLYDYAAELYEELERTEIINRLKSIPHLGIIKVPAKLKKTRYDYIMLQLYFHQIIKHNLQSQLKLTYNNAVKSAEFSVSSPSSFTNKPSIGDTLQLLCIVYNIGHFFNTFTASRAATLLVKDYDYFTAKLINSSEDPRFKETAERIIESRNYQRFHLLNSLLVLEHCSQELASVKLAQDLIYSYLNQDSLPKDSKLNYIFDVFKSVRDVSYVAYDLQIAPTPFTLDLWNEQAVCVLFKELLSNFNDRLPAENLMKSIEKMLDDTVYNENSNAICYYKISQRIANRFENSVDIETFDYYNDCFLSANSVFNKSYSQKRDYCNVGILKLTFPTGCSNISEELVYTLERTNNVSVGYYDRHSGERTVLVSIKKKCRYKPKVAFRVMGLVVSALRKIPNITPDDFRFLLVAKFFIHNLFGENLVVIKPTIHNRICTLCTRGKNKRITALEELLKNGSGTIDEKHEAEFILERLKLDAVNDTCITIPGSVLLYPQDAPGRKLCEFDGMVLFPYRKKEQIVLFESKNTKNKPGYGRRCLCDKLNVLSFSYDITKVESVQHDVFLKISV